MFAPDKELYPDYDDNLEQSMIAETIGFFGEVLRTNGSLNEFLDSDWTMLNERLATHYEIDESSRRSNAPRDAATREHHRGGLLTHGSILGLTSDGTRHRPVHRGAWMLESIIGKPPLPPPANVPALGTPAPDQKKLSVRQKLELHRSDPNCTACHNKIDPLGNRLRQLRRHRSLADGRDGPGRHGRRSDARPQRPVARRTHVPGQSRTATDSAGRPRQVRGGLRRETRHVRPPPRHDLCRPRGAQAGRRPGEENDDRIVSLIEELGDVPLILPTLTCEFRMAHIRSQRWLLDRRHFLRGLGTAAGACRCWTP